MAKLDDLVGYFNPGLELTVKGDDYVIPLPSAELGLWCRTMMETRGLDDDATDDELQAAADQVAALPELPGNMTFPERLLGTAYKQMIENKVEDPYVQFCAQTTLLWIVGGEDMAERFWKAGGHPEARGPDNRASRRANARKTSTAAAAATNSPGSTSGTSSPTRSSGSGRARRSRGRRS